MLDYLHKRYEGLSWVSPWPWKVIYIDTDGVNYNNPPSAIIDAVNGGATVIVLSFYTVLYGPVDMAAAWASADPSARNAAIAYAHNAGAVVLVSAGGATDIPYNTDPIAFGAAAATFAVNYGLDGLDMDLENLGPGASYQYSDTISWIGNASVSARAVLCPMRLLTHAPQAPYFGAVGNAGPNPWTGTGGGYTAIWKRTGPTVIDAFLVQFYNQGSSCYTTQQGLFSASATDCPTFPGTSLLEIASYGVPASRIVLGKTVRPSDGDNGWVDAGSLQTWVAAAASYWSAGIMLWAWHPNESPYFLNAVVPAPSWSPSGTPGQTPTPSHTPSPSVSPSNTPSRPPTPTQTPSGTPSPSTTPASQTVAPSPVSLSQTLSASGTPSAPSCGGADGVVCAISTSEAVTRAALIAAGQTPSNCTSSYQQCAGITLYPVQQCATGTACYRGAFVLQTAAVCAGGVWAGPGVAGSYSMTPVSTKTPPNTVSPSPPPTFSVSHTPPITASSSLTAAVTPSSSVTAAVTPVSTITPTVTASKTGTPRTSEYLHVNVHG